jgi:5-methylcytosine-specific restriction enzyme A
VSVNGSPRANGADQCNTHWPTARGKQSLDVRIRTLVRAPNDSCQQKSSRLVRVAVAASASSPPPASLPITTSLHELPHKAYDAAANAAASTGGRMSKQLWHVRSEWVRQYVLARANGTCEACDALAPFKRRDGTPYLEPHHTTRLADEGLDHPATVGAICPTCHRRIHSGEDGAAWNERLLKRIAEKEQTKPPTLS